MGGIAQRVEGDFLRKRRAPDEHAMVNSPSAYRALVKRMYSLSPRSAVRRRMIHRQVISAFAASNRRDFELMAVRYADDCVYEFPPKWVTLGVPARVEGRTSLVSEIGAWHRTWDELLLRPDYVLDLGTVGVVLGGVRASGATSGVSLDDPYAMVVQSDDGLVRHHRDFNDWSEALTAAGIAPGIRDSLVSLEPGAILELASWSTSG